MNMIAGPIVFVVDHDPAVGNSLRWLIESAGLRVETFENVEAFQTAFDPGRSGCLVLDVSVPSTYGPDQQETLTARGVTIPVIMVSACGDAPAAESAMKKGAFAFLEKPFNDQVFLDCIQEALDRDAQNRAGRIGRAEIML